MLQPIFTVHIDGQRVTLGDGGVECDCHEFAERQRPWCAHIERIASGRQSNLGDWVEDSDQAELARTLKLAS